MNYLLTRETINLVMGPRRGPIKIIMDDFLNIHGLTFPNGRQIMGCIGKTNARTTVGNSDGLSITFQNQKFVFQEYHAQNPIADSFNITTLDLTYIFGLERGGVNSLMVFLCENNNIIIEFSLRTCRGGGAGGEGVKVRLPTPPVL